MRAFLAKTRTVQDVQMTAAKQNIWRKCYAVSASFASTLKQAFPWCATARTRLLLCLRAWGLHVAGEQVALEKPPPKIVDARKCIRTFGTPGRLLVAFYRRLDVKLVLMNGSRCAHIWEPENWATRGRDAKVTVVLNVWCDHVSTYNADVGNHAPDKPTEQA